MTDYMTLSDIRTAIERNAKQFTGKKGDMLDHLINMVYLSEILSNEGTRPYFWLNQLDISRHTVAPVDITGITATNPAVITASGGHTFTVGDLINPFNVSGMTQINGLMIAVVAVTATTITTAIDASGFDAYTSGGELYHKGITLLHDTERVIQAGWNEYYPPMETITPEQMEADTTHHNKDNTGLPKFYYYGQNFANDGMEINNIVWSPAADNDYLLRYWYVQEPTRLSADSDTPLLPPRFHDTIVAGVLARLAESKDPKVSVENATLWPSAYASQLEAIKAYNERYWRNAEINQSVHHFMA